MTDVTAQLRGFYDRHEAVLWLLLIVCVAAALRFGGLTFQSYWFALTCADFHSR